MAIGRISGPLLKANLLRDGVDLAFESDLLYLDVINRRIGVKTKTPSHDLTIDGTTRTTNLLVDTAATIATISISGNTIASSNSIINLSPSGSNPVVYQGTIVVDQLHLSNNTIQTVGTATDLNISTTGTGKVIVNAAVMIHGNLHATGTITADGNITIGNTTTDSVTFNSDVASDILPDSPNSYDLGSDPLLGGHAWKTSYINDMHATNIVSDTIVVNDINLVLPNGHIRYVATTGNDTNLGVHEHNPYLTIKHALSQAEVGDVIYIYPGTYIEIFPLTVPVGVTIHGSGLRTVTIQPTIGTIDNDAFLLNGETTIEDLTISGYRFNSTNNTGYAFRFANNFTVTIRSPYVRNVTIISRGSVVTSDDPYGFDSNDAGKGAFLDGSIANSASKEATLLFHSVTFFTPNQETIIATNGIRCELINSFTYFADKGIYAYSSLSGFAGEGLTRLRIDVKLGSWMVGDTVSYYDIDGSTVLGFGVVASLVGDYVNLIGRQLGFNTIIDRSTKFIYANGNAHQSTAHFKFGTASLYLDGINSFINVASQPDFNFGTGDFTIELNIYRTTDSVSPQTILDMRTAAPQVAPLLYLKSTNVLALTVNGVEEIVGSSIPMSSWIHIALARHGTSTRLFVNGYQAGLTYTDTNVYIQSPVRIGAAYDISDLFTGYIDDFSISKGIAKYTTTFVPPTVALRGDTSTVLLLHLNGGNNSTAILDDGITIQDIRASSGGTASIINFADYSDFGAEIRVIGSANMYGNHGVYATGIGVTIHLIAHTFSFIGTGKDSSNTSNPLDNYEQYEITKLDDAVIYYTSTNEHGDFRVGDNFYIDQRSGEVLFNNQNLTITSATGVTFTNGIDTTTITYEDITTGNIRISGNTIASMLGDVNITAASGIINLQNDTIITGDLTVTGDVNIGGNITVGNQTSDTVTFIAGIGSNLVPSTTSLYDLGTPDLRWNVAHLSRVEVDSLVIDANTISTTYGNDDLILTAHGTGRIYLPGNNLQIDQAMTVTGTTSLHGVGITGAITQTGSVTQTGDYTQTGNATITGDLVVSTWGQFQKIRIDGNVISTTVINTDLIVSANGTGIIYIPDNNVQIDHDLTVNGLTTLNVLGVTTAITAGIFNTSDISITANIITTIGINHDLIIKANGTGVISIPSNNVHLEHDLTIEQNLTVTTGTTYLKNTNITGTIAHTGDINQTGNFTSSGNTNITGNITGTGYLQLSHIRLENNTISSIVDTDMELYANGIGSVILDGIGIKDNAIRSMAIDSDIILTPQGTGGVIMNNNQSLILPSGTTEQRPVLPTNGMIRYNTTLSRYESWNDIIWLQLGGVIDVSGKTRILAEVTPGANDNVIYFYADNNLTATIDSTKLFTQKLQTNNLDIDGNTISSIFANSDINLVTSGTGKVKFGNLSIHANTITNEVAGAVTNFVNAGTGYVKIAGVNGVVIPSGDSYYDRPLVAELGMIRFNTVIGYVEIFNGVSWIGVGGESIGITLAVATDLGVGSALIFG